MSGSTKGRWQNVQHVRFGSRVPVHDSQPWPLGWRSLGSKAGEGSKYSGVDDRVSVIETRGFVGNDVGGGVSVRRGRCRGRSHLHGLVELIVVKLLQAPEVAFGAGKGNGDPASPPRRGIVLFLSPCFSIIPDLSTAIRP